VQWGALFFRALAEEHLDRRDDAGRTFDVLSQLANTLPSEREKRMVHALAGNIALHRGEQARAISELKQAEAMLPAMNIPGPFDPPPPQVAIWFALGSAYLAGKDDHEAGIRFEHIVNANAMRLQYPVQFVRSLYFLGGIAERQGDRAKAAKYYRRFVQYWGDGDMDRDKVADARKKLSGT
jgi:tetratricopeptide (TPR) repeat protein